MTQHDRITCLHEPFGDAFYLGPERLSTRYQNEVDITKYKHATYKGVLEEIARREKLEGMKVNYIFGTWL
jgi:hypothetical protein